MSKINQVPQNDLKKWKHLITLGNKKNHFLICVIPFLYRIYKELHIFLSSSSKIRHWFDANFLNNQIYSQAEVTILPIILQTCILEMHVAKDHNRLKGKTASERFTYFIKALSQETTRKALFQKYPVMKQKLEVVTQQLIEVYKELFQRLNNDYEALDSLFFKNMGKYLRLKTIQASGDRHQGGREVLILHFENTKQTSSIVKLVYKPHSLTIDSAFQDFLEQFNACSNTLGIKTITMYACKNYGYCEFIEIRHCLTRQNVADFYFRLGMLFMLTYLFLGFDLHNENILAQGENPFIVDYECLLSPILIGNSNKKNYKIQRHFVIDMHLLPSQTATNTPNLYLDISGLNSDEDKTIPMWEWIDIGKDTMKGILIENTLPKIGNRPQLNGKTEPIKEYEKDFIEGFKTAYQVLLQHQKTLLHPKGVLKTFKKARVRIVPRPTEWYDTVLQEQHFPQNLLNSKSNRLHLKKLDALKKMYPGLKAIIPSEKADLFAETIPVFYAIANEPYAYDSQDKALQLDTIPGYDIFLQHVQHLSLEDMHQQIELIQASFLANRLNYKQKITSPSPLLNPSLEIGDLWSATKQKKEALSLATQILDNLADRAFYSGDIICWPYFKIMGPGIYSLEMTLGDLYDGISGILLPFTYAGQLLQNKNYQQISKVCIKTLRDYLRPPLSPSLNLGLGSGIGGILYVFKLLQNAGHEIHIQKDLKPLFDYFIKHIENDQVFDLIGGCTGGIAGCLQWYDHLPEHVVLPAIQTCVKHILTNYPDPAILPEELKESASQALLGMAHGLTGMIYILSQCNFILKDPKLDFWIKKALAYERSQFKLHQGKWPDFRIDLNDASSQSVNELQMIAWCMGPVGIGLAKLGTLPPYKDLKFTREIKIAAEHLLTTGLVDEDMLCHGNLGNLELLVTLAQQKKNNQDIRNTRAFTQAICLHIAKKMKSSEDRPLFPGLFKGDAGLAYGLLRIAFPEELPNILLPIPTSLPTK